MQHDFRELTVPANGIDFHCVTAGEGPLVLLLHGFPERWFSWKAQIPALAAAGYRVVAPDMRGYGGTSRPKGGYDVVNLARDVSELITALGEETGTVIGHDWGGAVTWEAVTRHPDRIHRFAALNCPHPKVLQKALQSDPEQRKKSWYMAFFQLPWLPERSLSAKRGEALRRMFRGMAVDRTNFTDEAIAPFRESVSDPSAVSPMLEYYRAAARTSLHDALVPWHRTPYPVIERPGLLLWAEEDKALGLPLVNAHLRWARDLRVERIPRCGHFLLQEQPETVNRHLVRWLADTRHLVDGRYPSPQ